MHEDEDLLVLHVEASHFLWKMVRRLVGVLVEVGRGQMPVTEAAALLKADPRTVAPLTAPASGLFLERVYYRTTGATPHCGAPCESRSSNLYVGTARGHRPATRDR